MKQVRIRKTHKLGDEKKKDLKGGDQYLETKEKVISEIKTKP